MKVVIMLVLLLLIAVLVVALSRVWRKGRRGMTHIPPAGVAAAHPIRVPRGDYDRMMSDEPEDVEVDAEEDIMRRRRLHADSLGKHSTDPGPITETWDMRPHPPYQPHSNGLTCPVCQADPGVPCRTLTTHKPTKMHAARTKD